MAHCVDEPSLEARVAAVEVGHIALRIELREDAMAAIQVHERVAIAALLSTELRMLARRFGGEQHVATIHGNALRVLEVVFGRRQLAHLARNRAEMLFDFAAADRVLRLSRERQRQLARAACRREVATHNFQLGAIDLDQDPRGNVAERLGDLYGLVECAVGIVPPLEVRTQHAHVVQRAEHFLGAPSVRYDARLVL